MVTKPGAAGRSSSSSAGPLRTSSGKLERMASWVGSGIYTAFVSSLDHCSCIKLDTIDISDPVRASDHGQLLLAGHHRTITRSRSSSSSRHLERLPSSPAALIIASGSVSSASPASPASCSTDDPSHQLVPNTKSKSSRPRRHRRPADPEIKEEHLDDTDEDLHSCASSSSSS